MPFPAFDTPADDTEHTAFSPAQRFAIPSAISNAMTAKNVPVTCSQITRENSFTGASTPLPSFLA